MKESASHDQIARSEVVELHNRLEGLLVEIDSGAMTASTGYRLRLEGAITALAALLDVS